VLTGDRISTCDVACAREQALYNQGDTDVRGRHGTIPRTMICLLVRDHLNFAQVEALNIDGFEDDSRLDSIVYITYHEVMNLSQVQWVWATSCTVVHTQPYDFQEQGVAVIRIRLVYQGWSTDRDSPR
jgi:hypothetical protein